MVDKQFLYIKIETSENQTLEQEIKKVIDEIESYDWKVVAYDVNTNKSNENIHLMTVYSERGKTWI